MNCPSCGATTKDGSAFCGSCGKPIVGYSVGQSPAGASAGGAYVAAGAAPRGDTGRYAGFWLRFVAVIIDGLILGIPFMIIWFVTIGSAFPALMHTQDPRVVLMVLLPRIFLLGMLGLASRWLYWALMESSTWQATLGKKALGIYVTDLEGRRISFGRATGRFFAKLISGFALWIGYIMAGFTEKKQALHDMIAGCLVQRNA
jgi:uncharacterized RDD family membrane protein YckC